MTYNKIITPLVTIQNTPTGGKPEVTSNLEKVSSLLLQECATEVFIVPYNDTEKELVRKELDQFPPTFKNRVKMGDENFSIKRTVEKYLEPTYEIGTTMRNGQKSNQSPYSDPYLETAIRVLALGCKKNAEVDIPMMDSILNRLNWAKTNCINSEGKARIDNLLGLFKCYTKSPNDDGFQVNPNEFQSSKISSRLDELLAEPDIQELSKLRYSFGIPSKLRMLSDLKTDLHLKAKKLLQNSKFTKLLSHSPQIISLALTHGTVSVPAISIPEWEKYNPPIVDLIDIRKKLLAQIPNLGFCMFLMGDMPLMPTPQAGQDGLVFHIPGLMKFDGMTVMQVDAKINPASNEIKKKIDTENSTKEESKAE